MILILYACTIVCLIETSMWLEPAGRGQRRQRRVLLWQGQGLAPAQAAQVWSQPPQDLLAQVGQLQPSKCYSTAGLKKEISMTADQFAGRRQQDPTPFPKCLSDPPAEGHRGVQATIVQPHELIETL